MKFPAAVRYNPEIDEWLSGEPNALYCLARVWFSKLRNCGPDINELMHDGCPVACVNDIAFAYVNVFTAHLNVGFFWGSALEDPAGLLQGTGKRMRHVKVRPGKQLDSEALNALIDEAYIDMQARV